MISVQLLFFLKCIEYNKKNYYPYFVLGEINIIKKDFKSAVHYYEQALKMSENVKERQNILSKLFIAYAYNGESELSKKSFAELKKINSSASAVVPEISDNYIDYVPYFVKDEIIEAKKFMASGEDDNALALLKKSLDIWDTPLANRYIGDILFKKRNHSLLYYYIKAYPDFKTDPTFLNTLCIAYLVNRQTDNAARIISEMKTLNPNYSEIPKLESILKSMKNP